MPTFSPCFGGPFLPQPPAVYAGLLGEKLRRAPAKRVACQHGLDRRPRGRRRSPDADPGDPGAAPRCALSGKLDHAEYRTDDVFGFEVPLRVPGVETELLDPRSTWSDPAAYDDQAQILAALFRENFAKFDDVDPAVPAAGPKI